MVGWCSMGTFNDPWILQQHEPSGINGPLVLFARVLVSNLPLKTWKLTSARHDSFPILAIHIFQSSKKNPNHQTPRHFRCFFCKIPLISHLFGFNFIEAILHFDTSVLHPFRGKLGMVYDIGCHRVYHRCFLYISNRGQDFRFTSTSNQD